MTYLIGERLGMVILQALGIVFLFLIIMFVKGMIKEPIKKSRKDK